MDKAWPGAYIHLRRRHGRFRALLAALPIDRTTIAALVALQFGGAVGMIVSHFFPPSRIEVEREAGNRFQGVTGALARRLTAQLFDIVDCKEGMRGRRSPGAGLRPVANQRLWCERVSQKCHALFLRVCVGSSMSSVAETWSSGHAKRRNTST